MKDYPGWIDEYAFTIHNAFSKMVPSSWQPNAFAVFEYLHGAFIRKVGEAVKKLKEKGISPEEAARTFSTPSGMRGALYFMFVEYIYMEPRDRALARETFEYLLAMLKALTKEDEWVTDRHIAHTKDEVGSLLETVPWQDGTPDAARELGRLYVSASAVAYSLYGDYFPQVADDVYGPYDASAKFGEGAIMVIKHFPAIHPVGLWPTLINTKYEDIKIYQVYKGVKFSCEFIGMHSLFDGDLREGLVAYAVEANGKFLSSLDAARALRTEVAESAVAQAKIRDTMTKDDIKNKVLEWLGYQCVDFFKLADMDWRPTDEMRAAVAGKEIPDKLVIEKMAPLAEFSEDPASEVYWLKDMYRTV